MEYPKKVMRMNELKKLGFPEKMLIQASREKNQTFCWKLNASKQNSPLLFDTDGLEKWRLRQAKLHNDMVAYYG